ncbi:hypothetical protein HPHPA8_0253 [Helicobacter pylori Hp A-8]|nr:hypothetical protein HPHPA8_0253 [Helicobacter pylori Hp A-8]EJB95234.1 hypothetical protein HPHPH23_0565 [Helicobacter pylori Hp H-23]
MLKGIFYKRSFWVRGIKRKIFLSPYDFYCKTKQLKPHL